HSIEPLDDVRTPGAVPLDDDLGVRAGAKRVTEASELSPQLVMVVDLAVEDDGHAAVGRVHRLIRSGRQIQDRETRVPEHRTSRTVDGTRIGPTVRDRGERRIGVDRIPGANEHGSEDATHDYPSARTSAPRTTRFDRKRRRAESSAPAK